MESYKWMGCSIIHAVLASFAKRKKPNTEKESMKVLFKILSIEKNKSLCIQQMESGM